MKDQIQTYLQYTYPNRQDIRVSVPERISTGWETEIFAFDLDYDLTGESIHQEIIMRMYPSDDAGEKSAREFASMKKLSEVAYPVPCVYHLERENSPWKKPFMLMERIEGGILWPQLVDSSAENQQALLAQFCELFVRLHQLDWRTFVSDMFPVEKGNPYQFIDRMLNQGAHYLDQFGLTGFVPVAEWVQDRREQMACDQPSVIHFDFHPANILLRSDGSAVVLDWSGIDVSDARFDVAWTLVLFGSYEGPVWRERILGAYEDELGVPLQKIETFEVFACLRRLFSIVASIQGGAEKMGMDPKAVSHMKEQMFAQQRVYDRLIKLTGIRVPEVENLFAQLSRK